MNRRHDPGAPLRCRRGVSVAMVGLAALAAGTIGFSSVAGAASAAPRLARPAAIRADAGTSNYLAGYKVSPTNGLASASVTFTVPSITCSPTDKSQGATQWDGVYTDTLDTYALVATICTSSGPSYEYAFATEAASYVEAGAAAGDVVVASLFQSATATFAVIHDLTDNDYWFADNSVNQGDTTVDIGALNDTYVGTPIPTYAKAKFSNATLNGDYLGFESPLQYNTVSSIDTVAKSSALTTTASGSSFSTKFVHAS